MGVFINETADEINAGTITLYYHNSPSAHRWMVPAETTIPWI
jgi:hypothetical protein